MPVGADLRRVSQESGWIEHRSTNSVCRMGRHPHPSPLPEGEGAIPRDSPPLWGERVRVRVIRGTILANFGVLKHFFACPPMVPYSPKKGRTHWCSPTNA
jgi:hypothetical protein